MWDAVSEAIPERIACKRPYPSTTSEVYDVYRDSMVAVGRTLWHYGKSAIESPRSFSRKTCLTPDSVIILKKVVWQGIPALLPPLLPLSYTYT